MCSGWWMEVKCDRSGRGPRYSLTHWHKSAVRALHTEQLTCAYVLVTLRTTTPVPVPPCGAYVCVLCLRVRSIRNIWPIYRLLSQQYWTTGPVYIMYCKWRSFSCNGTMDRGGVQCGAGRVLRIVCSAAAAVAADYMIDYVQLPVDTFSLVSAATSTDRLTCWLH